ncbi:hypothetical protein [Escherichia coli ISC7]|uniref:Uncharacterized protein n=1 Tax=Escherichia coli ISC7 TaxID=1432555 RepID=W1F719_ECOLX|nr:hypothetical protein [Escherichia coli ISC7]
MHNDRSQFTDWLSALRWWALCVSDEQKQSKSTPKNKTSSHINILHWW